MTGGVSTGMSGRTISPAASSADKPASRGLADRGFLLVVFAFTALVVAELALVLTMPAINYGGADGKAAQAEILATLEFARPFDITNLNPLQGLGSQMMPINVWVNPAYWPLPSSTRSLRRRSPALWRSFAMRPPVTRWRVASTCRGFPSIIAAQLSIMLFAPAVRTLAFMLNFDSIPGTGRRLCAASAGVRPAGAASPERPQVWFIAGGLLACCSSLYCDPLWTGVSGLAWIVPFAVVTFSPARRDTILARFAALGGCVAVLLLSGALEYVYLLSQYTARVQFPDLLGRFPSPRIHFRFFSGLSSEHGSTAAACLAGSLEFGCCAADREFSSLPAR